MYNWGATAHQARLPPTPPEYPPQYLTPMSAVSDQSFYPAQSYLPRPHSGRDFDRYNQLPAYAAQKAMAAKPSNRVNQIQYLQDFHALPGYAPQAQTYVPAPVLPSLRLQDTADYVPAYTHRHQETKPKEEKATGGVAAHLDYDMDLMASFVAEMAQKLVTPSVQPTSQFRKYVSQILSSTRLPSSTIMLGLFYLNSRMKMLQERGESSQSSGMVYRMLTICLLLGSKFLDDNTFQNRSWAEVSSISVHELNSMELDWLKDFDWVIHSPMYQEHEGFYEFVQLWHAYDKSARDIKKQESQKLARIDTGLRRSNSAIHQQPMLSPDGPIPPQYQQSAHYDTQWARPYMHDYSPPSAPHSGPATPDYYDATWSYAPAAPIYNRTSWSNTSAYAAQRSQPTSYHHTPSYPSHAYAPSIWTGHAAGCTCAHCVKQPEYYFPTNGGYILQPVIG